MWSSILGTLKGLESDGINHPIAAMLLRGQQVASDPLEHRNTLDVHKRGELGSR